MRSRHACSTLRSCDGSIVSRLPLKKPLIETFGLCRSQTAADLEYQRKLASILGHGGIPTRPSMKAVIEAQGIVASASPAVQAIYSLVEGEVDPLTVW